MVVSSRFQTGFGCLAAHILFLPLAVNVDNSRTRLRNEGGFGWDGFGVARELCVMHCAACNESNPSGQQIVCIRRFFMLFAF